MGWKTNYVHANDYVHYVENKKKMMKASNTCNCMNIVNLINDNLYNFCVSIFQAFPALVDWNSGFCIQPWYNQYLLAFKIGC